MKIKITIIIFLSILFYTNGQEDPIQGLFQNNVNLSCIEKRIFKDERIHGIVDTKGNPLIIDRNYVKYSYGWYKGTIEYFTHENNVFVCEEDYTILMGLLKTDFQKFNCHYLSSLIETVDPNLNSINCDSNNMVYKDKMLKDRIKFNFRITLVESNDETFKNRRGEKTDFVNIITFNSKKTFIPVISFISYETVLNKKISLEKRIIMYREVIIDLFTFDVISSSIRSQQSGVLLDPAFQQD